METLKSIRHITRLCVDEGTSSPETAIGWPLSREPVLSVLLEQPARTRPNGRPPTLWLARSSCSGRGRAVRSLGVRPSRRFPDSVRAVPLRMQSTGASIRSTTMPRLMLVAHGSLIMRVSYAGGLAVLVVKFLRTQCAVSSMWRCASTFSCPPPN